MSDRVMKSPRDDFMTTRGYGYRDLLSISPYEFSWYAMWLQTTQMIPTHQKELLIKVFQNEDHHLAAVLAGQRDKDFAKAYIGVVINSNS